MSNSNSAFIVLSGLISKLSLSYNHSLYCSNETIQLLPFALLVLLVDTLPISTMASSLTAHRSIG